MYTYNYKPIHQRFSELDNSVFSAFCSSFKEINWLPDFKDNKDEYCGIDVQLTAFTKSVNRTYDVEIKSRVTLYNFSIAKDCFFQPDKWLKLCQYDNDNKIYFVIYPNCDKIAIWNVTGDLLEKSCKDIKPMKRNTASGSENVEKQVYRLAIEDAKVYTFDLSLYKNKYNALYQEIQDKQKQK